MKPTMTKETYYNIKQTWSSLVNSGEEISVELYLLYALLLKDEKNFFKSFTPIHSEHKLKHTIYDYNYIVLWSIGRITTYIKSYETGNIYQKPHGMSKTLLDKVVLDTEFDMSLFKSKVERISTIINKMSYHRLSRHN